MKYTDETIGFSFELPGQWVIHSDFQTENGVRLRWCSGEYLVIAAVSLFAQKGMLNRAQRAETWSVMLNGQGHHNVRLDDNWGSLGAAPNTVVYRYEGRGRFSGRVAAMISVIDYGAYYQLDIEANSEGDLERILSAIKQSFTFPSLEIYDELRSKTPTLTRGQELFVELAETESPSHAREIAQSHGITNVRRAPFSTIHALQRKNKGE
jgi:hypothetical protein